MASEADLAGWDHCLWRFRILTHPSILHPSIVTARPLSPQVGACAQRIGLANLASRAQLSI